MTWINNTYLIILHLFIPVRWHVLRVARLLASATRKPARRGNSGSTQYPVHTNERAENGTVRPLPAHSGALTWGEGMATPEATRGQRQSRSLPFLLLLAAQQGIVWLWRTGSGWFLALATAVGFRNQLLTACLMVNQGSERPLAQHRPLSPTLPWPIPALAAAIRPCWGRAKR